MLKLVLGIGLAVLALLPLSAEAVTFNRVVTLGDRRMDYPDSVPVPAPVRSPVAAEYVAERLGAPLTKLALSGSTSDSLIAGGQHTQAAAEFGAGDLAMLWIGENDILGNGWSIAQGSYDFIDNLESNVDTVLTTLRGAGMEVVVFNLPDFSTGTSGYREVKQQWNDRLDVLAASHDVAVVDAFDLFNQLADSPEDFSLLGNSLDFDDVNCQFCVFTDQIFPFSYLVTPSSFAEGFIANVAIDAINAKYDPSGAMPLEQLSIVELAELAGFYGSDFDDNNFVNAADLAQWQSSFGATGADADGDLDTDGNDFLVWQRQFKRPRLLFSVAIPEPSSVALAFLLLSTTLAARPVKSW